jgi:hypothetical protein
VPIAFWSTRYFKVLPNVGRVKSSVDDLTMERGTVSMRVAFVLRSAEVQPLFRDLCDDNNDDVIIWLQTILHINGILLLVTCSLPILSPPVLYITTIQLL